MMGKSFAERDAWQKGDGRLLGDLEDLLNLHVELRYLNHGTPFQKNSSMSPIVALNYLDFTKLAKFLYEILFFVKAIEVGAHLLYSLQTMAFATFDSRLLEVSFEVYCPRP